jgi:hypothetical protein
MTIVAATALALAFGSTTSAGTTTTHIYIGGRDVGYVEGPGNDWYWYASWGGDVGAWVYRQSPRLYYAGCESESDEHRYGYAHPRTAREWLVATFPGFSRLGLVRSRSPTRWDIYDRRSRFIGHTSGRYGVPAALAWLAVKSCR